MKTHGERLATAASATTAGVKWPGGKGVFSAQATWGGGTVALQFQIADDSTWITPTDGSLTADGAFIFELPPCLIRVAITTATGVDARADRIPE
jgi:hypothetical protein